jgi:GTP pyrophosphokinase
VKTARARGKIRAWIRQEEFDSSLVLGEEVLDRELKRLRKPKLDDEQMEHAARALSLADFQHVTAALGRGDLGPSAVLRALFPAEEASAEPAEPNAFEKLVERIRGNAKGVRIQGIDNLMVRYSHCCQPVPGDNVIGYITRGRGISIHRADCPNVLSLSNDPERRIEIEWKAEDNASFFVRLVIEGTDRRGLLSDIATAITGTGTNISSAEIKSSELGMTGSFVVDVQDLAHLNKVIRSIKRVKGVLGVVRKEHFAEAEAES